jgi:hypothetical protein
MSSEQKNARHPKESLAGARSVAAGLARQIPQSKIHVLKFSFPACMIDFSTKLKLFSVLARMYSIVTSILFNFVTSGILRV